ncbi:MAG: outer membrane beta-barrel protein [Thermonemataceae bacterium]
MKKIVFTTFMACLFTSFSLFGQTEQGSFLISGALNFQTGGEFEFADVEIDLPTGTDLSVFAFTPRVGYFIQDNIAVGLRFGLAFANEEQETAFGDVDFSATGFQVAPFGRYYYGLSDRLFIYGELAVAFGSISASVEDEDFANFNLFQIGLNPGLAYMLSDRIGMELLVNGISFASLKEEDADEADTFLNIGPNLDFNAPALGIFLYF